VQREERRRSSLAFSDWIAPNLRLALGGALDRWSARGQHVAIESNVEARWVEDRLVVGAQLGQWMSLERGSSFRAGGISARWSTRGFDEGGWRFRAGASTAGSRAPRSLWPGAGTGRGGEFLLRAHPLLVDGVVAGRGFGRSLVAAGVERQSWAFAFHSARVGWIAFVDGAKPSGALREAIVPWQTDVGVGVRVAGIASRGEFRITAARGLEDGRTAIAVGWRSR
jgi:hypothetical protein